jgi:hypothetical protein
MLMAMKDRSIHLWATSILSVLLAGCGASHQEITRAQSVPQPQLVRFYSYSTVRLKPGSLFISGSGSAAADNGKYDLVPKSPFSGHPLIELTIQSDNPNLLESCQQRVLAARQNRQPIDIRGLGTYKSTTEIDPPLEKGEFVYSQLDACGAEVAASSGSIAVISTAAVPAANLVAVPERYLDQKSEITGQLVSPVQFGNLTSHLSIQSEGQFLSASFRTQALPADERLALVHAAPGSTLILEGTLTRATTGYEFSLSNVVSTSPR